MLGTLITHRGIDVPLGGNAIEFPMETTWEAFVAQLDAGFGLEFDIQPSGDGGFAISHDKNLTRLTGGQSDIELRTVPTAEVNVIQVPGGRLCTLGELLEYMAKHATVISALHLKASCQTAEVLHALIGQIKPLEEKLADLLMIFDATVETAAILKEELPNIQLAASVSHRFDIQRYGKSTGGTLLSTEIARQNRELYNWVWLDEWDRDAENGAKKSFVNEETVKLFRDAGFKIAAVSPELHATSPALLGGEGHEDGASTSKLLARWKEWDCLELDALCTDHASWLRVQAG